MIRSAAGATINVADRSGTNRVQVSGWEFFRDSSLTSEGYFKPAAGSDLQGMRTYAQPEGDEDGASSEEASLARDHEHPDGANNIGYEFGAPLDGNGRIDPDEWHKRRENCRVRRSSPRVPAAAPALASGE